MKTEHAIDWRKSAQEINDNYEAKSKLIESQAAEISELRELNLAQIKTIRTLQTKVGYYKEISEDMERELNGRV